MKLARFTLVAPVALGLAGAAIAQCSSGPFIGTPFGLSLADAPQSPYAAHLEYLKQTGYQTTAPTHWAHIPNVVDFRLAPLLRACGVAQAPFPDIDAMSLGEDWILADDATGRIAMGVDNWGGLTFSVTPGSLGRPGSTIRASANSPEGAAADVFSWILPGSAMPAMLVDRVQRAQGSREMDLGPGTFDVDSLDHFLPMWTLEPGIRATMLSPPEWYFSFSNATLNAVPPSWWANTTPSGATIFRSIWSTTTSRWSCPRIWLRYSDLGLAAHEDVDALAVDVRNQRVLFSTKTPTRNQILFVYTGNDIGIPVPYADAQGTEVSEHLEMLEDDDIDAICAMDPSTRARPGGGANGFFFSMGTPLDKAFPFPAAPLSSSAFRVHDAGVVGFETFLSGWPTTGQGPGFAALFLSFGNGPLQLLPAAIALRDPTDPTCGNPISATLAIPPVVQMSAHAVDLRWFVTDQAVSTIGEAWPIRIRL